MTAGSEQADTKRLCPAEKNGKHCPLPASIQHAGFRCAKGDRDIDGKCMDHTAIPAVIICHTPAFRQEAQGSERLYRDDLKPCLLCVIPVRPV